MSEAVIGQTVWELLCDEFAKHLSNDDLTLDVEAAEEPVEDLQEALGLDEKYVQLASGVALYYALQGDFPGRYVLPGGDVPCQN